MRKFPKCWYTYCPSSRFRSIRFTTCCLMKALTAFSNQNLSRKYKFVRVTFQSLSESSQTKSPIVNKTTTFWNLHGCMHGKNKLVGIPSHFQNQSCTGIRPNRQENAMKCGHTTKHAAWCDPVYVCMTFVWSATLNQKSRHITLRTKP